METTTYTTNLFFFGSEMPLVVSCTVDEALLLLSETAILAEQTGIPTHAAYARFSDPINEQDALVRVDAVACIIPIADREDEDDE